MGIEFETKDCTGLSDAELAAMADLCAQSGLGWDIGFLGKQAEEWVLVSRATEGDRLKGFFLTTLERIGGTPSVLIGLGYVARTSRRDTVLNGLMTEQLRRAVLAFPDEDVLFASRLVNPSGYLLIDRFEDVVPRPGHKATGEERAWGRRLVKRFGVDGDYDDRAFRVTGSTVPFGALDIEATDPAAIDAEVTGLFDGLDPTAGDCLIACGWAMAEDLARYGD